MIRKSRGHGQEFVASRLGVSQSNYSQMESGKISISLFQFIQIANILEVTPFMLLTVAGITDYYKLEQADYAQSLSDLRDSLMRAKAGKTEAAQELLRRIGDLLSENQQMGH